MYELHLHVNVNSLYLDSLEPKSCQSCAKDCQFENCSEHRKPICESVSTTLFFLIIMFIFYASYVRYILKCLVTKKSKPTSVNVLYTTSTRPLSTVTTSGVRTQYVSPHQTTTSGSQQTTTSGSQHTTVIHSQQTTRLFSQRSQRSTIYSFSITNHTTYNVGNNVNVTGGMYCTTRMTSSTERSPFLPNDYDLSKLFIRVCKI